MHRLFDNGEIIVYEQRDKNIWGLMTSHYYWADMESPVKVIGPFQSVLEATEHYQGIKKERVARPNVTHINFKMKAKMVGAPKDFIPGWTICECGQHYDQHLRNQCPNCGRRPVRLL